MKKTVVIVFVMFFAFIGMAYAGSETTKNCGCGLGSLLFEEQRDGLVSQVLAATTNGTFGNQTFGITTGTLGCDKFTTMTMKEKLNIFVADNMDNVATDIASGQGETIDAIADLAGINVENKAYFFTMLQDNFDTIYPSTQVTHEEVVGNIVDIIQQI
jgi:hypothetical protein